jgi:hypothetical protein
MVFVVDNQAVGAVHSFPTLGVFLSTSIHPSTPHFSPWESSHLLPSTPQPLIFQDLRSSSQPHFKTTANVSQFPHTPCVPLRRPTFLRWSRELAQLRRSRFLRLGRQAYSKESQTSWVVNTKGQALNTLQLLESPFATTPTTSTNGLAEVHIVTKN